MKWYYLCFFVFIFLFHSCNRMSIRCKPIPIEQIFGTYDLGSGKKIILREDFSYISYNANNEMFESDSGIWIYQSFSTRTNQIFTYDMRALSESGERNHYTRYMTNRFFACKHLGRIIIITRGYTGDPDGAPALKWFRKIK